ncbi:hypothetical protein Slin14017_G019510 [Septoria linicola]|nr:hypothetical protein Slin14017_G019510 [Septoria linicola]
MLPILATAALTLFTTARAQVCNLAGTLGPGFGPDIPENLTVLEANLSPNATRSVNFNVSAGSGNDLYREEWTWRVNVTKIPSEVLMVPSYLESKNVTDPYIINTVYDLQWPGGETLNATTADALGNSNPGLPNSLCVSIVDLYGLPERVTNRYQESDNGDCSNVLGDACAAAIRSGVRAPSANGRCQTPRAISDIPACKNTTFRDVSSRGAITFFLGNTTNALDVDVGGETQTLRSGEGFSFSTDVEQAAANDTLYDKRTRGLQMLILSGFTNQVLCQRVDTTSSSASSFASGLGGLVLTGLVTMYLMA